MAIGGESTGWMLDADGESDDLDLDVTAVREEANRLKGKRVRVVGQLVEKEYVERGRVRILNVERIAESK